MTEPQRAIRFEDGAAYERFMGVWSRVAGEAFIDWLAPSVGGRWADVGCGNGAFTETLIARVDPVAVAGIDPSEDQLAFARSRAPADRARFEQGDAMALPWPDASFDAAVMALVIFFVPEPARGVAELTRVVRPGGTVAAYVWDVFGGGFPYAVLKDEMAALGVPPLWPPSVEASRRDALLRLWHDAGLVDVAACELRVERTYDSFDDYWTVALDGPPIVPLIATMPAADVRRLEARMRERLPADAAGRITLTARANAIRGTRR